MNSFTPALKIFAATVFAALYVCSSGDYLKVHRVAARTNPAQMVNLKSIGDRAAKQLVGHSMSVGVSSVGLDAPVAAFVEHAKPQPTAGVWLGNNHLKESFLNRFGLFVFVLTFVPFVVTLRHCASIPQRNEFQAFQKRRISL